MKKETEKKETLPAVQNPGQIISHVDPVEALKGRIKIIQQVYKDIMKDGSDYGVIPGCGKKPALLKPGAEKIIATFGLAPELTIEKGWIDLDGVRHLSVNVTCRMLDKKGAFLGEGCGSCSTLESKYRYRKGTRKCPECEAEVIIKGKEEYGGGWLCWKKKGGCGAKFPDGDQSIESQSIDKVENKDVADQYNTVLKMAKKRAVVDATLTVSGVSDLFTQDIEEQGHAETENKSESTQPIETEGDYIPPTPETKPIDGGFESNGTPAEITALRRLFNKLHPGETDYTKLQGLWLETVGMPDSLTKDQVREFAQKFTEELKEMKGAKE